MARPPSSGSARQEASRRSPRRTRTRGKPVTTSSVESGSAHVAANAVDGNAATRWGSAYADPQWITVDPGAIRSINRVRRMIAVWLRLMRLSMLSFRYSRRSPWILRDVELTLRPGSVIEVTGRNGAGKSTLLRLMAGFVPPSRGSITDRPDVVGYAPDVFPVDQPFTVAAYLTHMSRIRGISATSAAGDLAGRLNATHLLDQPLDDLSKGSAQKIGLIQSLLAPPDLLILDEPFAGLDEQTRTELPVIIEEIAARGGTVVVSDHQKQLQDFPGAEHWLVADGNVTVGTHEPSALSTPGPDAPSQPVLSPRDTYEEPRPLPLVPRDASEGSSRQMVIEVIVDVDDADEVEQKLRADGYLTRRSS
ncbi:ATP-binding cassette domain-containing protein [Streptosporangium sp. NPDC002607]